MRLSRTDVVPVLAIIAGGAVGVLTSGIVLLARFDYEPPDPLVSPAPTGEASALPPPSPTWGTPSVTPYTVAPRILNIGAVRRAMFAAFPTSVRDAGVGGTATVYFFIDEHGEVQDWRIDQTSGHRAVDEAALTVASVFRFSPALNGDDPVPVWVSHAMTFDVR